MGCGESWFSCLQAACSCLHRAMAGAGQHSLPPSCPGCPSPAQRRGAELPGPGRCRPLFPQYSGRQRGAGVILFIKPLLARAGGCRCGFPFPLQAWLLLLGHQDVPASRAFALIPALTKILFFHAFFHGGTSAHSQGDLRPPLPSLALSSHLGDGFQRSHPLDGGRLVQPCEHPRAPCWGPDPEGAEHPWDREHADRVLPWAAIWGGPGLTPARCLQGCILPWVQRGARIFSAPPGSPGHGGRLRERARTGAASQQCLFLFVLSVS